MLSNDIYRECVKALAYGKTPKEIAQVMNVDERDVKVTHNNKKWISNVDNNHWEPGATGVYTWDEWTE